MPEVYTKDYSQSVIDDLNTCEKKILDYLRNNLLKDVLNKDLDALDKQIDELSDEIRAAIISGNDSQLSNYYTQLCTLMNQRQEFLRKQVNEDDELKSLYKQETALLAQIESWTKFSIAEEDGVVSYYFDGAEASLTPENMLDLTANEILNIQNGKSYYTLAASTESIPLYRLVNPNDWYVAVVSNEKIEEFETNRQRLLLILPLERVKKSPQRYLIQKKTEESISTTFTLTAITKISLHRDI